MNDTAIRTALERHWSDLQDKERSHDIYHDDAVLEFPQGGERLVGLDNIRAMRAARPDSAAITIDRMRGSGDLWITEVIVTYDGAHPTHGVTIMEFRDGKVARETIYSGEPWEAPAWRAQWVETAT